MLGITSGREFLEVKGVIEAIVADLNSREALEAVDSPHELLDPTESCQLNLGGKVLGYVGQIRSDQLGKFDLRGPTTVAEVKLSLSVAAAELIPAHQPQPAYPSVTRDLNLVVDETVRWADVAATVEANCDDYLENLDYRDTYRDAKRLGADKKSLLMAIALRSAKGTMTNQQADEIRDRIVAACGKEHGAELR